MTDLLNTQYNIGGKKNGQEQRQRNEAQQRKNYQSGDEDTTGRTVHKVQ